MSCLQIATLIDIHYAVSSRVSGRQKSKATLPPPPYSPGSQNSTPSQTDRRSNSLVVESPIEMGGGENGPPTPAASDITFVGEPEEEGLVEGHIISGDVLESRGVAIFPPQPFHTDSYRSCSSDDITNPKYA